MQNSSRCLFCYNELDDKSSGEYHQKCIKKLFSSNQLPDITDLDTEIEKIALDFIQKGIAVTGVQKKLSVHLDPKDKSRLTVVGALGGNYILKPQSEEYPELPENEDLTMKLAANLGIKVATHGLIRSGKGKLAYITKRFDRTKNAKLAVEDLCQLSGKPTSKKYKGSHEQIGKVIQKYTTIPGESILRFYELVVFSYLTGNADMHLKNFSILESKPNYFELSPAYDLVSTRLVIPESQDKEELTLTTNAKKRKLTRNDFQILSETLKIPPKVAKFTIDRFIDSEKKMQTLVGSSFLKSDLKEKYVELIQNRISILKS